MSLQIRCDQCGRSYIVQPEVLGRKVKCKGCGHTFTAAEPQPELAELVELNDLTSFDAATVPMADLSSVGLPSSPVAAKPKPAKSGLPLGALIAILAGGGIAALLLVIVIVKAMSGGSDDALASPNSSSPAVGSSAAPPSSAGSAASTSVAAGPAPSSGGSGATLPVTTTIDPGNVAWSVTPDPAPAAKPFTASPLPTGSAAKIFFARRDVALALACRDDYSTPGGVVRAEKFDLTTGRNLGGINLPAKDRVLGFSSDGKYLLAGSNGYEGSGFETLRVWSWSADAASEASSWSPYSHAKIYNKVTWAAMPRGDLILTNNGEGELIGWSFPNPQQRFTIKSDDRSPPLLTPGGRFLARCQKGAYRFFETATGKPAGQTDAEGESTSAYAAGMSPEGDRLAAMFAEAESSSGWRVYVWDLKTGKLTARADVLDYLNTHVQFLASPFLLAGNSLIDLERQATVWKYTYSSPAPSPPDTRLWFTAAVRGDYRTYSRAIPSTEERAKVDAAWRNASVVIPQGSSISIEAAVPADAPATNNREALFQQMLKKLQDAGYQAAPDQPQKLRVTITEGGSGQMMEFRSFSSSQLVVQVPDKRLELKVALLGQDGKEAWTRSNNFGPMIVTHLKPGDMSDPAKAILSQRWEMLNHWLTTLKIPPEIRSTMTATGLGATEIKAEG
jgi:predicted Zn finger-like uncharacterized protein